MPAKDKKNIQFYLHHVENSIDEACLTLSQYRNKGSGALVHTLNNLACVLVSQKYFLKKASSLSKEKRKKTKDIDKYILDATIEVIECISLVKKILSDNVITKSEYKTFQKKSSAAINAFGFFIGEVESFYEKQKLSE